MFAWLLANVQFITVAGAIVTVGLCLVLYRLQPPQSRSLASRSVPPPALKIGIILFLSLTVIAGTLFFLWAPPEKHDKEVALATEASLGDSVSFMTFLPAGLTPTDENSFIATMSVNAPMHRSGHCAYHATDFSPALYIAGADVSMPGLLIERLSAVNTCKLSPILVAWPEASGSLQGFSRYSFRRPVRDI